MKDTHIDHLQEETRRYVCMCIETLKLGTCSLCCRGEHVLMELNNNMNGLVDTVLLDALKQVRERKRMNS